MGTHLVNGQFQSDKYPSCPPGKVPLSVNDSMAQDLLWLYAHRRRFIDAEFADDLKTALRATGFVPKAEVIPGCPECCEWCLSATGGVCTLHADPESPEM